MSRIHLRRPARGLQRRRRQIEQPAVEHCRAVVPHGHRRPDQRVLPAGQGRRAPAGALVDEAAPARRVPRRQQRHRAVVRRHCTAGELEPRYVAVCAIGSRRARPPAVRHRRRRVGRHRHADDPPGRAQQRALPARLQRRRDDSAADPHRADGPGQRRAMATRPDRRRARLFTAHHAARRRRQHYAGSGRQARPERTRGLAYAAAAYRCAVGRDAVVADHARRPARAVREPRPREPERARVPELPRQAAGRLVAVRHLLRPRHADLGAHADARARTRGGRGRPVVGAEPAVDRRQGRARGRDRRIRPRRQPEERAAERSDADLRLQDDRQRLSARADRGRVADRRYARPGPRGRVSRAARQRRADQWQPPGRQPAARRDDRTAVRAAAVGREPDPPAARRDRRQLARQHRRARRRRLPVRRERGARAGCVARSERIPHARPARSVSGCRTARDARQHGEPGGDVGNAGTAAVPGQRAGRAGSHRRVGLCAIRWCADRRRARHAAGVLRAVARSAGQPDSGDEFGRRLRAAVRHAAGQRTSADRRRRHAAVPDRARDRCRHADRESRVCQPGAVAEVYEFRISRHGDLVVAAGDVGSRARSPARAPGPVGRDTHAAHAGAADDLAGDLERTRHAHVGDVDVVVRERQVPDRCIRHAQRGRHRGERGAALEYDVSRDPRSAAARGQVLVAGVAADAGCAAEAERGGPGIAVTHHRTRADRACKSPGGVTASGASLEIEARDTAAVRPSCRMSRARSPVPACRANRCHRDTTRFRPSRFA
ncbi:hypothetical protein Bcep18194_A5203 [Burkholderia lata]|uniref:Uncharacterized protein n=1 Tax=Burkholderia lata (strain ATCC 17760 / DSM 23089 / LMG 22485 / NCIMB 9086 / R18194 / 383) TaxID=482957 RepID=Q39FG9_BURL3|nr:hypothetical protein Bcep18194_A5203 [Burkholderia lata]